MTTAALTLGEFLARLGSSDPTPGGGALAAVVGASAAAMLSMVCNFTVGRPRYADVDAEVRALHAEVLELQARLLELADADAAAYQAVSSAYRLPRANAGEVAARTAAIEASMRGATEVPVATMEAARRLLDLALRAAETTNPSTIGDVAVAAHVALGATRAAADQARLNLATMADETFVAAMRQRIQDALADADTRVAQTVATVDRRSGLG